MNRSFLSFALIAVLIVPSIASGEGGMSFGGDPSNQPHPYLLEAKVLMDDLPAQSRSARRMRLAQGYAWRASVVPKLNQIINGKNLSAPAVDPGRCRKYSTPLPTATTNSDSTIRVTVADSTLRVTDSSETIMTEPARVVESTDLSYWDMLRTDLFDLREETVGTSTTEFTDTSVWDSFRDEAISTIEPEVTEYDLCMMQEATKDLETKQGSSIEKITQLLVDILKEPALKIKGHVQAAEAYQTALTTVYLNGRLMASPQEGTGCMNLNLLDVHLLSSTQFPEFWNFDSASLSHKYGLKPLIMQLSCLSDGEVMRLVSAFANAWQITTAVVASTQPQKAAEIRNAVATDYLPLVIALFDRTKAAGPSNPLYKMLLEYRKAQGYKEDYGIPYLLMLNPATQKHEEVKVCGSFEITGVNAYLTELWGYSPGPGSAVQYAMKEWMETYNDQYKKGKGPKTIYGASISELNLLSETLKTPVWITDDMTPNVAAPPCVYLPNFLTQFLHPMPLGDATCPAWDTARLGKICDYKPVPTTVSQAMPTEKKDFDKLTEMIESWILPSAHAVQPPTPKCFNYNAATKEWVMGFCIKDVCPCGNEVDDNGKQTLKCKECPYGGGSVPSTEKLSCESICKYRYGMEYAGGGENINIYEYCVLSTPLVEADNVTQIVVPVMDYCNIAKGVKVGTINSSAYDACMENGNNCCGNLIVEEGEACDDGNGITTDQCSNFCKADKDCQSACNFGYGGPATKALKSIVDQRTNFHPVYRWLGTALFFQSNSCTLPNTVSDGTVVLKQGKPCKEVMAPLMQLFQKEQAQCIKQCKVDNPNLPPPVSQKAAGCFAACAPEKMAECKASKQFYAKMQEPGCTLANGVKKGEKVFCSPGAPCICGWNFVLEPCKQIVAACKADCADKYDDTLHNDEMGEICSDWSQSQSTDPHTSAMNWFQETTSTEKDVEQYSKSQTLQDALQAAKEGGAKKLDAVFGMMMDWIDYDNFSALSAEDRALVKGAAQYALSKMSTCDGFRAKYSETKVKGTVDLSGPLAPVAIIGPAAAYVANEYDKHQPFTILKQYYDEYDVDLVTFDYWAKGEGGSVEKVVETYALNSPGLDEIDLPTDVVKKALVPADVGATAWSMKMRNFYTVAEKVVPKLKIFAILGRASLLGDFADMGGDTPIKPEFELAEQLQLCVNPEGLTQMSAEDLAKLGLQQAMVAAMQFQDWVRHDKVDAVRFDDVVDTSITASVESKLGELGIKIPKSESDPSMMTTVCDTYFSSGS